MKSGASLTAVVLSLMLAGCGGSTAGTPVAESAGGHGKTTATVSTVAPSDLSPPTTALPNPEVKGASFDACASVADAQVRSWELDPASKRDTSVDKALGWWGVRGCLWDGPKWFVRIYAFDGTIDGWKEQYRDDLASTETVQFGSREGLIAHALPPRLNCRAVIPSQQGLVAVMVNPAFDLEKQKFDVCPLATRIMTDIEPRIPQ